MSSARHMLHRTSIGHRCSRSAVRLGCIAVSSPGQLRAGSVRVVGVSESPMAHGRAARGTRRGPHSRFPRPMRYMQYGQWARAKTVWARDRRASGWMGRSEASGTSCECRVRAVLYILSYSILYVRRPPEGSGDGLRGGSIFNVPSSKATTVRLIAEY